LLAKGRGKAAVHIHSMPPTWLDHIAPRPKVKSEEIDFEALREAAAKEAERDAAEREKHNRRSAARATALARSLSLESQTPDEKGEADAGVTPSQAKINFLA
jgi:hypothetical protein